MSFIDTHTHLTAKEFDLDRDAVIDRAVAAGVLQMVTIGAGYGAESMHLAVALAESRPEVFATVGIHPNDASTPFEISGLEALAIRRKVVAIGETGLDYFKNRATPEQQRQWFVAQIGIARRVKKPLIIHSREAGNDCLQILQDHGASEVGGVFHCYAEDAEFAAKLRKLNFLVSFPGSITFKKNDGGRRVLAEIPLSQVMIETDAPYMAPEPHRGKRCESSFVVRVAETIASVHNRTITEVAEITTATARKFYRLDEHL
jgi:TatD DNase family protein